MSFKTTLQDKLRAWPLLLLFALCIVPVLILAPVKLGLALWGIAKLGMGGYAGYHIDRAIFPYARPHTLDGIEAGTAWKRRALIVAAAIIAMGLLP